MSKPQPPITDPFASVMRYVSPSISVAEPTIQPSASDSRYGCGMRAVFSAMRRSFASAAMAFASSSCGARKTSRCVSRTANNLSRSGAGVKVSRQVMTGLLSKHRGEPASRLPLGLGTQLGHPRIRRGIGCRRIVGIHRLFGRSLRHRKDGYVGAAFGFGIERHETFDLGEQSMVIAHT